jgi:hypothetical protein
MSDIQKLTATFKELIAALPSPQRAEFLTSISACFASSELTSVGTTKFDFDSISAAGEERHPLLTPIQAKAKYPHRANVINEVMARARNLGYDMKPAERVSLVEFDRAMANSPSKNNIEARIQLKTDMAKLGML